MKYALVITVILVTAGLAFGQAGYPAGYFYAIQGSDTICVEPIIVDETIESLWFNYYSSSMHTGFEEAYKSKIFFFYNPHTGNMGVLVVHNIDISGTSNATCQMFFIGLPDSCVFAVSDDPSHSHTYSTGRACGSAQEFDLECWPQGGWQWGSNTDGGAMYLPRAEWKFSIDHYWGGTDPITSWWFLSDSGGTTEFPLSMTPGDTLFLGHGFLQLLPFPGDSFLIDEVCGWSDTLIEFAVHNSDETIDTLYVTGADHTNPLFTTVSTPGMLAPDGWGTMSVRFSGASPGLYIDTVWAHTNEPCGTNPIILYVRVVPPAIDSVWFYEETDCNDSNIVHICYILSCDTADIAVNISPDSGGTWISAGTSWFTTLLDTLGDFGNNVVPGTHCFDWIMSADLPDTESPDWLVRAEMEALLDTFEIVDSFDISGRYFYGHGLGYGDGYFWIYDHENGYVHIADCPSYILCPALDSFYIGDDYNCDIEFVDSVVYFCTNKSSAVADDTIKQFDVRTMSMDVVYIFPTAMDIEGVAVVGDTLYASHDGWYLFSMDISSIPATTYDTLIADSAWLCTVLEGLAFANGFLWGSNNNGRIAQVDLDAGVIVGCYPVPNVGMGAEGLCWDGEYLWYQNNATEHIYKINIFDSTASSKTAAGPLDSKPPAIELTVPTEPVLPEDSCRFDWNISDLFQAGDSCYLSIFGCGIDEIYTLLDTAFTWFTPAFPCPSCTVVVAARDSFCNWGADTATIFITQRAREVEFPWLSGHRCDTVLVPLYIDSLYYTWIDSAVMRFSMNPEILVPLDIVTEGSFTDMWFITDFAVFPDSGIIQGKGFGTTVYGDTGGVFIYLKAYVPCDVAGGSYTTIEIDTMFVNDGVPELSCINGLFVVELMPRAFSCDLRLNRTEGTPTEDHVLTFGAMASGTDGYDPGLDIRHVPIPAWKVDGWFPINDEDYPHIEKLIRDIRLNEPPRRWVIATGDEPYGVLRWEPDRLPEGEFRLDGIVDMKRDSTAFFEAFDTMTIDWTISPMDAVIMSFETGWNLVSSPVLPAEIPADEIFSASMGIFRFVSSRAAYDYADYISAGEGYWVWADTAYELPVVGSNFTGYRWPVYRGWNLIGALSEPVFTGDIEVSPSGGILGDIFGYDGSSYFTADSLMPGDGYWLLCSNEGVLHVPAGYRRRPEPEPKPEWTGDLIIGDNRLVIGYAPNSGEGLAVGDIALPPVAPNLDPERAALIADNIELTRDYSPSGEWELVLRVESTVEFMLPENIAIEIAGESYIDGDIANLIPGVYKIVSKPLLPDKFAVVGCVPNPFNSQTDIIVALPEPGEISLDIFDISGRKVNRIVGDYAAGFVHISWDGRDHAGMWVPSGLYFVRVKFGDETTVAKAVLLK
ncbi:hypothetical protein DRQ36_02150 [bacterium]|nr:MAG: hypothetical protein DRQ36_02150 [bacterium]